MAEAPRAPARPPRIGVDYWPATTHAPGIGRYVRELVRALAHLETPPHLRLFDVGPGPRTLPAAALGLPADGPLRRLRLPLSRRAVRALAWAADAARMLGGVELFHRVFPSEPAVRGVPQVLALPEVPRPRSAAAEHLAARLRSPHAIGDVIVMSQHARDLVLEQFDLPAARVHRVPVGCDHWIRDAPPLDRAGPGAEGAQPPTLLVLGATDRRRRHASILAAFGVLRARGVEAQLVFSGRRGNAAGEVTAALSASPWRADVTWHDAPREEDMPRRVAAASVLVHLNDDEHTPVTPLEACAAGAAVVASTLPAFGEALGDEATLLPATVDTDALADALAAALESAEDPQARARRMALASSFTWDQCARETQTTWKRILTRDS